MVGRVFPIPSLDVSLRRKFWHAKIILRCKNFYNMGKVISDHLKFWVIKVTMGVISYETQIFCTMTSSLHNEWGGTWLPGTLISFRPERWPRFLLDKRNLLDLWLPDSRRRSANTSNQTRRCDKQMSPNLKTSALLPGRSYICESNRNEISQKMSSLIKSNQWSAPSSSCNDRSATAPRLLGTHAFAILYILECLLWRKLLVGFSR